LLGELVALHGEEVN